MRLRLTALYGCLFLLSGAGLLVITNALVQHQSTGTAFYITRASGDAQAQIKGVVGGFSAPVIPPVAIVSQTRVGRGATAGPETAGRAGTPGPAGIAQAGPLPIPSELTVKTTALGNPSAEQLRAQARQLTTLAAKQRSTELGHLLGYSAIALGIMAVISIGLGWLISGRALRPLDEAFEAQRRFVANASHELRTPLAMMRTSLDVTVAKPGPSSPQLQTLERKLREGLDQADRLLESFLTLARAQRGTPPQQSPVSIAQLLRATIADHAQAAAERGVEVRAEIGEDARLSGSETLLRRMLDNLIDNAISHNEPGGWVRLAIAFVPAARSGGANAARLTRIVVENTGPRLSEDDVAQLTEPFRRPGAERTGSQDGHGLGLSIVAAIAAAHAAALSLHPREQGGMRVCVDLPRSPAPAHAKRSGRGSAPTDQGGLSEGDEAPAEAALRAGAPS